MRDTQAFDKTRLGLAIALLATWGVLLQFWGNTTRGYVDSASWFVWWYQQWFAPGADLEHTPLLLAGSLLLWWRAWRESMTKDLDSGNSVWAIGLLWATTLQLGALWLQQPRLSGLGLPLVLGAAAGLAGGSSLVRHSRTARWLLLLALPWGAIESLGWSFELRLWVASVVKHAANLFGAGLVAEGTGLRTPDGRALEVAAACAGLRSWLAMTALAVFLGDWWRLPTGRRWTLLAVSWLVVILGNLGRVGILVFLALHGGGVAEHEWLGIAVFAAESLAVAAVASRWEIPVTIAEVAERAKALRKARVVSFSVREKALVVLMVGVGAFSWVALYQKTLTKDSRVLGEKRHVLVVLPNTLDGGWRAKEAGLSRVELEILPPDASVARVVYERPKEGATAVLVTRVKAGADRSALHRPELCLRGSGWSIQQRSLLVVAGGGEATLLELSKSGAAGETDAVMLYWYAAPGRTRASFMGMMWDQVTSLLGGARESWESYSLQTWVQKGESSSEAVKRLLEVAAKACPQESVVKKP